jgi:hypothetical protein
VAPVFGDAKLYCPFRLGVPTKFGAWGYTGVYQPSKWLRLPFVTTEDDLAPQTAHSKQTRQTGKKELDPHAEAQATVPKPDLVDVFPVDPVRGVVEVATSQTTSQTWVALGGSVDRLLDLKRDSEELAYLDAGGGRVANWFTVSPPADVKLIRSTSYQGKNKEFERQMLPRPHDFLFLNEPQASPFLSSPPTLYRMYVDKRRMGDLVLDGECLTSS